MRFLAAAACCFFSFTSVFSQTNVGIGTTAPTHRLHVVNTADPLRLEGIGSGAASDSILTINASGVVRRRTLNSVAGSNWLLDGNTTSTSNFIGTTNAVGLFFRTFNQKSGFLDFDSTKRNNSFGNRALNLITTGTANNALGYQALYSLTSGSNNVALGDSAAFYTAAGSDNVAIGADALENNIASANIAIGTLALNANNFSSNNLGIGTNALTKSNGTASGQNIAIGNGSLSNATVSSDQVVIGYNAGLNVQNGSQNTIVGSTAFGGAFTAAATTANTVVGFQAGSSQISGNNNTYIGTLSGGNNVSGSNSTYVGYQAGPASGSFSNSSAFGNGAVATASNMVRIGNTSVTVIGGSANWSNLSDERVKTNVREDVKGLSFISLLRPVTYNYNLQKIDDIQRVPLAARTAYIEKQGIRYTGFLAQEVEAAAQKAGYNFSGVNKPQNDQSLYSISYAEMVVPLVKAVQELKEMVEKQQAEIDALKKKIQTTDNGQQTTNR